MVTSKSRRKILSLPSRQSPKNKRSVIAVIFGHKIAVLRNVKIKTAAPLTNFLFVTTKIMGVFGLFKSTFDWILRRCKTVVKLMVYFVAFCFSAVLTIASLSTIAMMIAIVYRYFRDDDDDAETEMV